MREGAAQGWLWEPGEEVAAATLCSLTPSCELCQYVTNWLAKQLNGDGIWSGGFLGRPCAVSETCDLQHLPKMSDLTTAAGLSRTYLGTPVASKHGNPERVVEALPQGWGRCRRGLSGAAGS